MVVSASQTRSLAAIWHELECGSYRADLALWQQLADLRAPTVILDIGAGRGRVTLPLARMGHKLIALDNDQRLLDDLRTQANGLQIQTVCADARSFSLAEDARVDLCLVPMQTIQLFGGADGRSAFLKAAHAHMNPGGLLACAILNELEPFDCREDHDGPTPESAQIGDRLYTSQARRVAIDRDGVLIERRRTIRTPTAHSSQQDVVKLDHLSAGQLECEASTAGFHPEPARVIQATTEHTDSAVVMLRA